MPDFQTRRRLLDKQRTKTDPDDAPPKRSTWINTLLIVSVVVVVAMGYAFVRRVFIAPPWRAIFERDNERKQTFEEAVRTYEALAKTYVGYGYGLIELPRLSIAQRLRFVIDAVSGAA